MTATEAVPVLLIGSQSDPHATAVGKVVEASGGSTRFLDAASLVNGGWRWLDAEFQIAVESTWVSPRRAWLRRLAPAEWHQGIVLGSVRGAEASAALALLTALSDSGPTWLSTYWATARAESKLVQDAVCRSLGIPTPRTIVCADPEEIEGTIGSSVIVKPLGVGEYVEDGVHHVVHTLPVTTSDPQMRALKEAPFIVQQQIKIAAGEKLPFSQRQIELRGHAIECRINAEDPVKFTPSPGRITMWHPPGGPGVRVDSHAYTNYFVPPNYDSMIGKIIVHGDTRDQALARMRIALSETVVEGIQTNIPLHRELMVDTKFIEGGTSIHYLEGWMQQHKK